MASGVKPGEATAALDAAGEDEILSRVADGDTMRAIATSYGVSRRTLYNWIAADEGRQQRFEIARQASADADVEAALEILDSVQDCESGPRVAAARERAGYRRWLASVKNRRRYGDTPQVAVQVNLGDLHLDALRSGGSATPAALEAPHTAALPAAAPDERDA